MARIQVVIVSASALTRAGLQQIITRAGTQIDMVASFEDLAEADTFLNSQSVRVLISDEGAHTANLVKTLKRLLEAHPGLAVILVMQRPTASIAQKLLALGVRALLHKDDDLGNTLNPTLQTAVKGNVTISPLIAAFLNGMSVRPVIGIPWSEDNAAWFARIGAGAEFRLQMNTGAILTFTFEDKREVRRSDTGIFRQVNPGLVLLLLGETDEEGLPTGTRTLVTGIYPLEQELGPSGELIGALAQPVAAITPTAQPAAANPTVIPFVGLDVQIVAVTTEAGRITTRLRLYNGWSAPLPIAPDDLWLALGYAENPPGPRVPAEGLEAFDLLPGQAADMTLVWSWAGEPFGSFGVGARRYSLQF